MIYLTQDIEDKWSVKIIFSVPSMIGTDSTTKHFFLVGDIKNSKFLNKFSTEVISIFGVFTKLMC